MRPKHVFFVLCLLLTAFGLGAQTLAPLATTSLDKRAVTVPVPEKVNVLVVSFTQKGGEGTKTWGERFLRDFGKDTRVACYAVAVLASVPGPFQGMVVGFIQGSTTPADRARFLTTFTDDAAWKAAAGYQAPDDTYVVVVDPSGKVVRRFHEPFTEDRYASAADAVRSLLASVQK